MTGRWALTAAMLVGLFVPAGEAAAQGRPGTGPVGVKVKLSQATVAFPTPGVSDFDTGWVDGSGLVVSVEPRPNQGPWELRVRADVPDMGGYGKPVTDILWRPAGSSTWTPLTGTDQAVVQGAGDQVVTVFLRLRLDYTVDEPNAYAADLLFYAETL